MAAPLALLLGSVSPFAFATALAEEKMFVTTKVSATADSNPSPRPQQTAPTLEFESASRDLDEAKENEDKITFHRIKVISNIQLPYSITLGFRVTREKEPKEGPGSIFFAKGEGTEIFIPLPRREDFANRPLNNKKNEKHREFTLELLEPHENDNVYILGTQTTHMVTVLDNDPPAAPAELSLNPGAQSLTASWEKPDGPVAGYQLRYKEELAPDQDATTPGDPSTGWIIITPSGIGTSAEITGLTQGTAYHVQVRANDGQAQPGNGYGGWSASQTTVTTRQSTEETTSETQQQTVPTFEFELASESVDEDEIHAGKIVDHDIKIISNIQLPYLVELRVRATREKEPKETTGSWSLSKGMGTEFPIPFPGSRDFLTPPLNKKNEKHREFTLELVEHDGIGNVYILGTQTTHMVTVLDNDPPAAPAELSLNPGAQSLTASWEKPDGPVAGYQLRYKEELAPDQDATTPGDPSTGWIIITPSGIGTSAEITGLTQGTAYHVQVRANDGQAQPGNGYGGWSASQTTVTTRQSTEETTSETQQTAPVIVSITGGEAVTEGEAASFMLTATPRPAAPSIVVVDISDSGDFAASGAAGRRTITVDASGTASFSVATEDDDVYEDDGAITATVVEGTGYTPSGSEKTAAVTVEDNDPGLVPSSAAVTVSKGGSGFYTLTLSTKPTGNVDVSISGHEDTDLSLNPPTLTFTPENWDKPQSVTTTAPLDANDVGNITLIHRPSGGDYDTVQPVQVQVQVAADPSRARAWHVRFGRSVSQQVVDALQQRFSTSSTPSGLQLTVAGEDLTSDTPLEENHVLLSRLLGFERVSSQELAQGSSFSFSPDGAGPRLSFWGKGAFSSFNGVEESITLTGDVTTALVGAEWSNERWQAGAALSHSWGNGSYQGEGDGADGRISSSLTGIFPYGRYALTPRLGLWATAGYGWGSLSLNPDGDGPEYNPATTLALGAVGMDGLLLDGGNEGITLTTTADALFLKTSSEAVEGLASSEGNITRLRLGLEATRPFPLSNGASLSPSLEVGLRQDSGDAETGFGMDLGAGLSWNDPEQGITATVKGRTLLSHGAEDFQDQGLALSFSWQPSPSNRGASLSLSHAVGLPAEGGLAALLNPTAIEVLDEPNSSGERFEARLAYGFPFYNDRLTLTPAVATALSNNSRTYGLLWSLAPYDEHLVGEPWQLSLEGERQETSSSTVDHSLKLRFALPL